MRCFRSATLTVLISKVSHLEALISYFNYLVRLKSAANRGIFSPSKVRLHLNDNNKCQNNVNAHANGGDALAG